MIVTEKAAEFIVKAQKCNKQTYGEIVKLYMKRAYFSALSIVGSHDDALDLSQEAFIRAYRSIKILMQQNTITSIARHDNVASALRKKAVTKNH